MIQWHLPFMQNITETKIENSTFNNTCVRRAFLDLSSSGTLKPKLYIDSAFKIE